MDAYVVVTEPDGSRTCARLEGERVTVGRGATAGVRLPTAAELEAEHLLLVPSAEACWVGVARGARTVALVDGAPLTDGPRPWETELTIGPRRYRLTRRAPAEAAGGVRPVIKVVAVIVVALSVAGMARGRAAHAEPGGEGISPSELFDPPAACEGTEQVALHDARGSLADARARGERMPFDVQDGVTAARLYDRAERCAMRVGLTAVAATARAEGESLRERLEGRYQGLRLTLARAYEAGDSPTALDATRDLRELLRHREDDYTRGLAELERNLAVEVEAGP